LVSQPDPELQAVKEEIAHLKTREVEYLKILQAAACIRPPVPEVDWSDGPNYLKRLAKFGLITPFKLTHCKEKTEEWTYHWARARATPQQIEMASYWIERFKMRGYLGLGPPLLFLVYMWSKRKQ
jgi:hypothetical protein